MFTAVFEPTRTKVLLRGSTSAFCCLCAIAPHALCLTTVRFFAFFASCLIKIVFNSSLELNVLPVTAEGPLLSLPKAPEGDSPDLAQLKASLASTPPSGVLVALAKTIDQAKAVLTFIEAISEKTLRSTVALTAGRGRGKSAALGISMAAAVAYVSVISKLSFLFNHDLF